MALETIKLGRIVLGKRPKHISERILIQRKNKNIVEITYISPDGLAGATQVYKATDIKKMREDIANFF